MAALASSVLAARPAQADAPPPLEAYARLPHIDHVVLSPSGKRSAFVISVATGRYVVVTEGGKPVMRQQIAESLSDGKVQKQAKIDALEWADDEHLLLTLGKTEDFWSRKYEFHQVLVLNLASKKVFWVFAGKSGQVLQDVYGGYGFATGNGHVYGYFAGQPFDEHGGLMNQGDLFQVDLNSGQISRAAPGTDLQLRAWLLAKDGSILAYSDYGQTTQVWKLYEGRHRDLLAEDKNPYDSAGIWGQGRTPGTLIYEKPGELGDAEYFETALSKGAPQTRLFEGQPIGGLLHDLRTGLLSGVVTQGDYPDRTYFDRVREARWTGTKKAFPNLNVSLQSADDAFEHLIVLTEGEGDPGTYWSVDLTTGDADPVGSAYPDVPPKSVGPRRIFDYKAADGLQLHGVLTLPVGREPKGLPVIVLPHGGPHARDHLGFDWWAAAPGLARLCGVPAQLPRLERLRRQLRRGRLRRVGPQDAERHLRRSQGLGRSGGRRCQARLHHGRAATAAMRRWRGSRCSTGSTVAPWPWPGSQTCAPCSPTRPTGTRRRAGRCAGGRTGWAPRASATGRFATSPRPASPTAPTRRFF